MEKREEQLAELRKKIAESIRGDASAKDWTINVNLSIDWGKFAEGIKSLDGLAEAVKNSDYIENYPELKKYL